MSEEKYICETCRYSGGSCEKRRANCSIPCGDWEEMSEEKTKWIYLHPGEEGPMKRPSNLQEWHFRDRRWVDVSSGSSMWRHGYGFYRYQLKPEREPITADTVLTGGMEVYIGDGWFNLNQKSGYRVRDILSGTKVRYINEPDTEYTYTKPIEWVTPTDEDARHRPCAWVRKGGGWIPTTLMAVCLTGMNKYFIASGGDKFTECRMDAKQREEWK